MVYAADWPALTVALGGEEPSVKVVTGKATASDAPPTGGGLATVTSTIFPVARSAAPISALNWKLLTKVVGRPCPSHKTTAPSTKSEPVAVRTKAGSPALAPAGWSEVRVGRSAYDILATKASESPPPYVRYGPANAGKLSPVGPVSPVT